MNGFIFFLDGIVSIAKEGIDILKKITVLRETDMRKLQALGKREATSGVKFLQELFKDPLTSNGKAANTMKLSRSGAIKLVERFTDLGILYLQDNTVKYGRTYAYKNYINIFNQ